jgi:hypothetical protein
MISDRGTFSAGHLLRLDEAGYDAIAAAPWDDFCTLFDEHRAKLKWKQASYLSIEQQRRRTQGSLPKEHYELAVVRHELTERESGKTIPCRAIFVFSTADQKVAQKVSVHGVTEDDHRAAKWEENQTWKEGREVPDGSSEGGGAPRR